MTHGRAVAATSAALVLVRDRDARARLREALRPGVPGALPGAGALLVRCVDRVAELLDALGARPYALVVVAAVDADGTSTEEAIRAVRRAHPETSVVGYAAVRPGLSAEVLAMSRAGVHELVVAGVDDVPIVLRAALARGARRSSAERVLAAVDATLPAEAVPLVRYCLEHAAAAPTVPEVARALGVSRQTLSARMRAARLPTPQELNTWCRLLLAADLIVTSGRGVEQVSLALDFPSANALRNALRRAAGIAPRDLRDGGHAALLAAFRAALAGEHPARRPTAPQRPAAPAPADPPRPTPEPAAAAG